MGSEQGDRSQASPGSFRTVTQQRDGPEEKVVNATSIFATPRSPGPVFRPARRGNRPPAAWATMP